MSKISLDFLLVCSGGAIGAGARFAISNALKNFSFCGVIVSTLVANLLGCFLIGLFIGAARKFGIANEIRLFFVTGFLGALTTFSTFSHESLQLLSQSFWHFGANVLLNVLLCLSLTFVGYLIFK